MNESTADTACRDIKRYATLTNKPFLPIATLRLIFSLLLPRSLLRHRVLISCKFSNEDATRQRWLRAVYTVRDMPAEKGNALQKLWLKSRLAGERS
jgi:hypothetical protein